MSSERISGENWGGASHNLAPNMYYPRDALDAGISGVVVVHCTVGRASRLVDCAPVYESPPGHGFGQAAVAMQREMALPPGLEIGSTTVVAIPFCPAHIDCAPIVAEGVRAKDRMMGR